MNVKEVVTVCVRIFIEILAWVVFKIRNWNKKHIPLPPITNKLLLESATSLAEKIRRRQVSSEETVTVFIQRIKSTHHILNAVVETRFADALKEAIQVDDYLRKNPEAGEELRKTKPFYGVPITTKENLKLKGFHLTTGLYAMKDNISKEDADVVRIMKDAGAIIIGTTNVPELVMWWETANTIYGRTNNPYDIRRMVGGSSGGEAAIVSAAGSTMGIGTDIGGSIRMPAHFTGIFGHKATPGLISTVGMEPDICEFFNNYRTAGPMCKHACDLRPTLKLLTTLSNLVDFDKKVNMKNLKIYYMEDDGNKATTPVSSEMKGALLKTVEYFKSTYNTPCEKVNLPQLKSARSITLAKMSEDPTAMTMAQQLAKGKGQISIELELLKMPFVKSAYTYPVLVLAAARKYLAMDRSSDKHKSTMEEFNALDKILKEMLTENAIFLYPPTSTTALYHYESNFKPLNFLYTAIFNVLRLPATVCPVGLSSSGLPLGVQIVAARYNDNLCISIAEEIEKAFGGWVCPSEIK